jgi:hypothetical protein
MNNTFGLTLLPFTKRCKNGRFEMSPTTELSTKAHVLPLVATPPAAVPKVCERTYAAGKRALPICRVSGKLPSMEAEIDDKLPYNSR